MKTGQTTSASARSRNSGKLVGKTAVVTGGSRGIGAAIGRAFANEGAAVALIHRGDEPRAAGMLREFQGRQVPCMALDCDVGDELQVQSAVQATCESFGGVDILVNCAGIGGPQPAFEDMTLAFWNQVMNVNLTGAFLMSLQCYPLMKKKRWGRIINITSIRSFSGSPSATVYCASKAGLSGFTRALAVEGAPFGVLVNDIAPGAIMTDLLMSCGEPLMKEILQTIPLGRFGLPEEIAATALMLASDEGAFYVGQTLSPNGGSVFK